MVQHKVTSSVIIIFQHIIAYRLAMLSELMLCHYVLQYNKQSDLYQLSS